MKSILLLLGLVCLAGCAGTHGYAAGNNDGAGMGIDVFHARLP
jgi:hypothetical protein